MKTTIMEFGLLIFAVVLAASFLAGFNELLSDGGNLKESILDYINDIC
jgi:hypothetical protein